jgi:glycosyltransferase involved in cell wall biosynthesis
VHPIPFWARRTTSGVVQRAQNEVGLLEALSEADLVVVENVLSLPMDRDFASAVAAALRGRPAILRHHDLPWQRAAFAGDVVPDDPAWIHVVINTPAARELQARQGIEAVVLPNRFPTEGWRRAPVAHDGRVVLHPVRAIPRKDVAAAVRLAERLGATYWLTGSAEDGYDDELAAVLGSARCPVRREAVADVASAYAACDAVAFPSTVEGFGNPVVESALARRPLAVRRYPVLVADLEPLGFRWFAHDDADGRLARFLEAPDEALLDHNEALAREHFSLDRLPAELAAVLERVA